MQQQTQSIATILGGVLLLSGCAAPITPINPLTPVPRTTQFVEEEYAPYRRSGTGRIVGQVFLRTRGGEVKYGAGVAVKCNPATTHGREWMAIIASERIPANGDPRAVEFFREVQCDGFGNFEIANLPPGKYCLASGLVWDTGQRMTGSTVTAMVEVQDGQTARAMLTR